MHRFFSILPTILAVTLSFASPCFAEEDSIDVNALLETGQQLLVENEDKIRAAANQLLENSDELRNKILGNPSPTAEYDVLATAPVSAQQLQRIQEMGSRAVEQEYSWAKSPVLAALRYQKNLNGGSEEIGYQNFHVRCQLNSAEGATEAVVIVIEDGLLDDSIQGQRWDIFLELDQTSNCWIPSAASSASLERPPLQ